MINGDFELSADRTKLSNQAEALVRETAFRDKLTEALDTARLSCLDRASVFGKLMARVDKDHRTSNTTAMDAREK